MRNAIALLLLLVSAPLFAQTIGQQLAQQHASAAKSGMNPAKWNCSNSIPLVALYRDQQVPREQANVTNFGAVDPIAQANGNGRLAFGPGAETTAATALALAQNTESQADLAWSMGNWNQAFQLYKQATLEWTEAGKAYREASSCYIDACYWFRRSLNN